MIRIKRVYESATRDDGRRILIDRLWPRGLSKTAAVDVWAKEVAPTTELRTWLNHRPERFAEFKRRYLKELKSNSAETDLADLVARRKVTLLHAAKDPVHNHAVVLAEYLSGIGRRSGTSRASASARATQKPKKLRT